ncbi:hypothetical protein [Streptomyces omiyaensis]|uniref:Uncharacterized protein n=1 Tax=Streptomyces omiyaensis TaxID=68247 RepID=A0ABW7C1B8_9ACTN|nr:hypothetical protein [Streptomyces omiyaensis]GGY61905.1 hypothetical protein GCM10010363_49250 [Streptomyces omiyaensis]
MPKSTVMPENGKQQPFLELRIGGVHLIIQRVPGWLIGLVATLLGGVLTWWMQQ